MMFLRQITQEYVKTVTDQGEIISEYLSDQLFPSCLLLHFVGNRPIQVVFSYDQETSTGCVLIAYIPDPALWQPDVKTKR